MNENSVNARCEESDFRRVFGSSTSQLHWLCYTLTGSEELARKVLDAALEQSLKGAGSVFREWMVSWARRLVIKVCIVTVRPSSCDVGRDLHSSQWIQFAAVDSEQLDLALSLPSDVLQQKLLRLDTLSRFVFVLRALEGYSRRDTALLLDLDDRTCELVYSRGVRAIQPNVYVMKSVGSAMELVTA